MSSAHTPANVRLYHGTDIISATDILQNGLNEQQAIIAGGDGHFWATTDAAYCNWYAKPARLEFDLPHAVLQDLLSKPFMVDHVEPGDNYDFYPASFSILNAEMTNKHVVSVP